PRHERDGRGQREEIVRELDRIRRIGDARAARRGGEGEGGDRGARLAAIVRADGEGQGSAIQLTGDREGRHRPRSTGRHGEVIRQVGGCPLARETGKVKNRRALVVEDGRRRERGDVGGGVLPRRRCALTLNGRGVGEVAAANYPDGHERRRDRLEE